jgi:hypothetical protein
LKSRIYLLLLFPSLLLSSFQIYNMGDKSGEALLIIGGIHGNEQGSYLAPSLLVQHYKIKRGRVRVVPNLNSESIRRYKRGYFGDMNRKFNYISHSDHDYKTVEKVKELVLDRDTALVLNLHDGSGIFRKNWYRWGQSVVIDDEKVDSRKYGYLQNIANRVVHQANLRIENRDYLFGVKNTDTKKSSLSMQKTLTYFAFKNNIPAFGVEASKNIKNDSERVLYHLLIIEEFMNLFQIEFERDFELNLENIENLLADFGYLQINRNSVIPLSDLRDRVKYFPMERSENSFRFSHPLGEIKKERGGYGIYIWNRRVTTIYPQTFSVEENPYSIQMEIDGKEREVKLGSIVKVKNWFRVVKRGGERVNVIGYRRAGFQNEANLDISADQILKKFSIDKNRELYRVEIYGEGKKFYGMVIVEFE